MRLGGIGDALKALQPELCELSELLLEEEQLRQAVQRMDAGEEPILSVFKRFMPFLRRFRGVFGGFKA